jgi:hypothetical protein
MKKITMLVLITLFASTSYAGLDVLMAASDVEGFQINIINGLLGFSDFDSVDWWNMSTLGTPSLSDIEGYDCVVTWSDDSWPDATAWGNTLADYVDGGGTVVLAVFSFQQGIDIQGRIITSGYSPMLTNDSDHYSNDTIDLANPDEPGHPFLDGLTSVGCGYRDYVYITSWGHLVAHFTDGEEALAYNDAHNVSGVNIFPGCAGYGLDWFGDFPQLLRNVIVWMNPTTDIQPTSLGTLKAMYQ